MILLALAINAFSPASAADPAVPSSRDGLGTFESPTRVPSAYTYDQATQTASLSVDAYVPACAGKTIAIEVTGRGSDIWIVCEGVRTQLPPTYRAETFQITIPR